MILTQPADTSGVVVPKACAGTKHEDNSDSIFADLLSAASEEKTITSKTETESSTKQEKDQSQFANIEEILRQISAFLGQAARDSDAQRKESIAAAMEAITDILEGNAGDTDIAALPAGDSSKLPGSGKEDAILARMPQIMELFLESGGAATEEMNRICSDLCPLENISEQDVLQIQIVKEPGNDEPDNLNPFMLKEDARTASAAEEINISGDRSVLRDGRSVGSAPDEKVQPDNGIPKEPPELKQTESTDDPSGQNNPDIAESAAMISADVKPGTNETVKIAVVSAAQQLADMLSSYEEEGSGRFEIRLEPENLGKLSITLSMSDDGLKAQIHTQDAQVHSLLASEISALVDKLSENGVQIKSLDVICSDIGDGQLDSQNSGGAYSGQDSGSHWRKSSEEILTAYETSESTRLFTWVYDENIDSTVSYRV